MLEFQIWAFVLLLLWGSRFDSTVFATRIQLELVEVGGRPSSGGRHGSIPSSYTTTYKGIKYSSHWPSSRVLEIQAESPSPRKWEIRLSDVMAIPADGRQWHILKTILDGWHVMRSPFVWKFRVEANDELVLHNSVARNGQPYLRLSPTPKWAMDSGNPSYSYILGFEDSRISPELAITIAFLESSHIFTRKNYRVKQSLRQSQASGSSSESHHISSSPELSQSLPSINRDMGQSLNFQIGSPHSETARSISPTPRFSESSPQGSLSYTARNAIFRSAKSMSKGTLYGARPLDMTQFAAYQRASQSHYVAHSAELMRLNPFLSLKAAILVSRSVTEEERTSESGGDRSSTLILSSGRHFDSSPDESESFSRQSLGELNLQSASRHSSRIRYRVPETLPIVIERHGILSGLLVPEPNSLPALPPRISPKIPQDELRTKNKGPSCFGGLFACLS